MSFFNIDVHSEIFTPQEYPVEILEAAKNHDVVCCCLPSAQKQFLSFMLFKEFYHRSNGVSVFVQDSFEADDSESANIKLSNKILGVKVNENLGSSENTQAETNNAEKQLSDEDRESPTFVEGKTRQCSIPFENLSSIHTLKIRSESFRPDDVFKEITKSSVVICSKKSFLKLLKAIPSEDQQQNPLEELALVVIDNVHEALKCRSTHNEVKDILDVIRHMSRNKQKRNSRPRTRVVCLTISLLQYYGNESDRFWRMERTFKNLQDLCGAPVDTSSNVTALLRYSVVPSEKIIPYETSIQNPDGQKLSNKIGEILENLKKFVTDHTYDPIALYGFGSSDVDNSEAIKELETHEGEEDDGRDSLAEELKHIPDPKEGPLRIINQLKLILDEFGPWCADRALLLFTREVEELRVHTPYERHYLLLGLLFTQLISIHVMCQDAFAKHGSFKAIENFCTPKLLALIRILRRFDLSQPLEVRRKTNDSSVRDDPEENSLTTTTKHITTNSTEKLNVKSSSSHGRKKRYGKDTEKGKSKKSGSSGKSKVRFPDEKESQVTTTTKNSEPILTDKLNGVLSLAKDDDDENNLDISHEDSNSITEITSSQVNEDIDFNDQINGQSNDIITEDKSIGSETTPTATDESIVVSEATPTATDEAIVVSETTPSTNHEAIIVRETTSSVNDDTTIISETILSTSDTPLTGSSNNNNTSAATNVVIDGPVIAKKSGRGNFPKRTRYSNKIDENALCGLLLTENRMDAKILYHFIKALTEADPKLRGLVPEIALPFSNIYGEDSDEAEREYKRRENSLRKFRYREANLLIGTTLLEEGIELPKANLVIRFDEPKSFRSYLFSKGRAQAYDGEYYVFSTESQLSSCLRHLATFKLVEEMLLSHSIISKPITARFSSEKELEWDILFPRFKLATLSNSISIVNRYCARLPSDTFTRLTPVWWMDITDAADDQDDEKNDSESERRFACTIRLPINSPIKWPITGVPMPSEVLAKRAVALQTVVVLHSNGEIDDSLMPIGKEGVSQEPDLCTGDEHAEEEYGEFRPGSTKRRQYYDKQLPPELTQCLPKVEESFHLYWLHMTLTCPLPDEQNTRGRRLHPPELAVQSFGILLAKKIPTLPPFPIYTRCGEVQIQLVRVKLEENFELSDEQLHKISAFHHYTFTSVLRLDKYLTLFDPVASENSYYVIALKAKGETLNGGPVQEVEIDWAFMDIIWLAKDNPQPSFRSDEERKDFAFSKELYVDAVVMPWYRNNDQPQYFYVAEICENLTPQSQFPGCEFKTFEEYYQRKYQIAIQNPNQPLLDVDHTSARLNFLTPRYVNRKGMALPTSSETTKKAKRENLEQKQILVPELCAIHPFSGSLWRQAVSLPCILYRTSSLLLANNIRVTVASQIKGLGRVTLSEKFSWEPLSFGWTLSDVIGFKPKVLSDVEAVPSEDKNITKPSETIIETRNQQEEDHQQTPPVNENKDEQDKEEEKKEDDDGLKKINVEKLNSVSENGEKKDDVENESKEKDGESKEEKEELSGFEKAAKEPLGPGVTLAESLLLNDKLLGKSINEILSEEMKKCRPPQLEIGTWTNEMACDSTSPDADFNDDEDELLDPNVALPSNLMMLDKNWTWGGRSRLFNHRVHRALYGSPTHWGEVWDQEAFAPAEDFDEPNVHDNDNESVMSDMSGSTESFLDEDNNLKVQFINAHTAETLDKRKLDSSFDHRQEDEMVLSEDMWWHMDDAEDKDEHYANYKTAVFQREESLKSKFQQRVDEKVSDMDDMVCWDISKVQARSHSKQPSSTDLNVAPNPHYETMFKVLTPIHPPQIFPESEKYRNDVQKIVEDITDSNRKSFSFDYQPSLEDHVGPSPCQILQALTMSNANDGLNLERLETIGDSFLKYAITSYLFCTFENIHEGKLSHLRSKQVSNVHLYRLGRKRGLGGVMVSAKFEPHDNWLPPCYHIPKDLDKALIQSKLPRNQFSMAQVKALKGLSPPQIEAALKANSVKLDSEFIPYNLVTQQSIPDKSLADCVEALIGAYLTSTGSFGALLFMSWLGIRVLPSRKITKQELQTIQEENKSGLFYMEVPSIPDTVILFNELQPPKSPLLRFSRHCEQELSILLKGYEEFENLIGYSFRDKSYLLQAFTHASYYSNTLSDCYQRLEFLGDAILDYLITRHLYEDPRQHSPGSLTDLRSALVNNTIFASLAVKNNFHKYFRHCSPGLSEVLQKFVSFQEHHGHTLTQDYYLMDEEECEEAEDIEVPKALGDVFESVAGAVFLDSGMSLDAVWNVYYRIMKDEIEQFSQNVPKSPIRELLELEPETAKFGKPEKLWDGRRVRVSVEIIEVGVFRGIGRNYRIAKCTAAKCALRHLRKRHGGQKH